MVRGTSLTPGPASQRCNDVPALPESIADVFEAAGTLEFLPAPGVAEQLAITNAANQIGQRSPAARAVLLSAFLRNFRRGSPTRE